MEENPYKAPMGDEQNPMTPSTIVRRPWCLGIGTGLGASLGGTIASAITWAPSARSLEKPTIALGIVIGGVTLGAIGLTIDIARWHFETTCLISWQPQKPNNITTRRLIGSVLPDTAQSEPDRR
jgi:hypothetical protein